MRQHAWIGAVVLLAVTAPARGDDAATAGGDATDVALVLTTARDEAEAKAWKKRWYQIDSLYSQMFSPDGAFPQVIAAKELGSAGGEPGALAVVLGFCSAREAATQLAFLRTIYPGATSVPAATPRAHACPRWWGGSRMVQQKTVEIDGWRLVVSQYLANPPAMSVPVGRKNPPDPNSGELFIVTTLLDPDGFMKKYEDPMEYRCVTDELEWPNTCDLKLTVAKNSITVDMKWGQRPHPCSGDVSFMHVRSVFNHTGKAIEAKREVLKRDVVPTCD